VAASDSPLVRLLETQGPATHLAISHIRHATHGAISLANTQPFVRELGGRTHVFAHNGHLPGIGQDARFALKHFHPVGETDSEQACCALLDRLQALWQAGTPPPLDARLAVVSAFAAELRELGPANFLYADGEVLFAHGHRRIQAGGRIEPPGLFLLSRQCHDEGEPLRAQGLRIGCGAAQGLAFGANLPVVGVVTLAAMAEEVHQDMALGDHPTHVLACIDARMHEIYAAAYRCTAAGVEEIMAPAVLPPAALALPEGGDWIGCGNGFSTYPDLLRGQLAEVRADIHPHARSIARLANMPGKV